MPTQTAQKDFLVNKLYGKLALVEMERKLIKISCNLIEDDVYTTEDAVDELLEIIQIIELERRGIMSDMG